MTGHTLWLAPAGQATRDDERLITADHDPLCELEFLIQRFKQPIVASLRAQAK
jgi:hypothetical protein